MAYLEMSSRDIPRCLKDYDAEMFKLYELSHYAGVDIDPSLFRCLVELLKADVHPEAIVKCLQETREKSPYGVSSNQNKIMMAQRERAGHKKRAQSRESPGNPQKKANSK